SINSKFSQFANFLQSENITVNRIDAKVNRDLLKKPSPDVIAIARPKNIQQHEIGLLTEWVIRNGGNLWVCSEKGEKGGKKINMLVTPFGLSVSGSLLEDDMNFIMGSNSSSSDGGQSNSSGSESYYDDAGPTGEGEGSSTSSSLGKYQKFKVTRQGGNILNTSYIFGVTQGMDVVSFYGASGMKIPSGLENTWVAVKGERTTYTPKSPVFLKGSYPPLVVGTKLGEGRAVFVSDCDLFKNKNIKKFENAQLAVNTMEWLIPQENVKESDFTELVLRTEGLVEAKERLKEKVNNLKEKLETQRMMARSQETEESIDKKSTGGGIPIIPVVLIGGGSLLLIGSVLYLYRDRVEEFMNRFRGGSSGESSGSEESTGVDTSQLEDELDL
ncbi:MAG: DUF4350 domain-containing protein, partial [Candidatus Nanohaloarchaea archaeon]